MPDGDNVHSKLNRPFQSVYKQIREGHWEPSQLAYRMLHCLKAQIKSYGNGPISLGQDISSILESALNDIQEGISLSFSDIRNQIEQLSRNPDLPGSPRGRDMMKDSGKKLLQKLEYDELSSDISQTLYKMYIDAVFKNDFESIVHDTPEHYQNASRTEVIHTVQEIGYRLEPGQNEFANQLAKHQDVAKLRCSKRLKEAPLTIEDAAW